MKLTVDLSCLRPSKYGRTENVIPPTFIEIKFIEHAGCQLPDLISVLFENDIDSPVKVLERSTEFGIEKAFIHFDSIHSARKA